MEKLGHKVSIPFPWIAAQKLEQYVREEQSERLAIFNSIESKYNHFLRTVFHRRRKLRSSFHVLERLAIQAKNITHSEGPSMTTDSNSTRLIPAKEKVALWHRRVGVVLSKSISDTDGPIP